MLRTKAIRQFYYLQSILLVLCLPFLCSCQEMNTITSNLSLRDFDTIESSDRAFQLGFFSPPNNTNRYLGIFYTFSRETIVWVANRIRPLNDSTGHVTIAPDGNLVLRNKQNEIMWSTNVTGSSIRNTSAHIEDTGNLLLRDTSSGNTIWESFSYPSDVFLPTMRLTHDTNTNEKIVLTSWRNSSDPEVGNFTSGLDVLNIPQFVIWNNGHPFWRSGPWNGRNPIGVPDVYSSVDAVYFTVENDGSGRYYYTAPRGRYFLKSNLNSTGSWSVTLWNDQRRTWDVTWFAPHNECDIYGTCGPFGSCNIQNSPICSCLRGFEPTNVDEWNSGNWKGGCRRSRQLQCSRNNNTSGNEDVFLRLSFMKVPDFPEQFKSMNIDECRIICRANCSCIGYAYDQSIGCMFWTETFIDVQEFTSGFGVDFFIRLEVSELGNNQQERRLVMIIVPAVVGFAVICIGISVAWYCYVKRKGKKEKNNKVLKAEQEFLSDTAAIKDETENVNIDELPLYTFDTLANATKNFDESNFLGKGGFGSVYKGFLENGNEVAVKRLSAASGQGNKEFMNEVVVISKLQHRNLVKLLGCCVEREEKMLIYEYMPNKSLDICLYEHTCPSKKILDWKKRLCIIEGVGRGLLYLHMDSRLKIIHRDLKPSNVLLDEEWNPKISDFGTARIFGGNKEHDSTARVIGTYGYMSPEYAMEGRFSEKSDVYSFGVLILEILSGKKITNYYNQEWSLSLLGCAWKLWNENKGLSFVDQSIANPSIQEDISRCIHVALLCVQEHSNDRPNIQTVLSMLSHEILDLPKPKETVFAEKWNQFQVATTQTSNQFGQCTNELTITMLDGR